MAWVKTANVFVFRNLGILNKCFMIVLERDDNGIFINPVYNEWGGGELIGQDGQSGSSL